MSIKFEWRQFSSGTVFDFSDRVNLSGGDVAFTENAEELTVGASSLVIEDPDGDFDIGGHSYIRVTETDAPDDQVIWAGFVTIRHIKRDTYRTEAARTWTGNLDDVNTVIARRILSETNDADRPAETDVERIQWLFDEAFLGVDDTYFSHANPVDMDAANLVGMTVYDAVNDCMLQSGKNAFQQDMSDGLGGFINFTFYDFASGTALSSDLRISNYPGDITADVGAPSPSGADQVWAASQDTDMARDPTRVYWKVRGQYDGGVVTRTRLATAVEFAARETTASWPLVKTAAKANARADRYLLDIATEEDVITTTIWVHPEHVNDARAGRRIQARFTHLPGYEDWTWMRILNRTVTFLTPLVYRITYTLSPGSIATPAGSCTSIVSSMVTYDSGELGSIGGSNGPPLSVTPTAPVSNPAVFIGGIFGQNGTTEMAHTGTPTVTGFTELLASPSGATATVVGAGYKATTGSSPGGLTLNFTLGAGANGAEVYRALAIELPTAATSPVQSANQIGSGGSITLGAPPTPGNVLVLVRFVETSPFAAVPAGYSQLVAGSLHSSSPGNAWIDICVRCVQEGDTALQALVDTSFTHYQSLSEWAL
jgi:hypothetical protein